MVLALVLSKDIFHIDFQIEQTLQKKHVFTFNFLITAVFFIVVLAKLVY